MLRHFTKAKAIADLLMCRSVHCMCGLWSLLARRSAMCCESEPGSLSGTISRCRARQLTLDTASPLEVMKVTSCIRLSHSGIPSPPRPYPHTTANTYFVSVVWSGDGFVAHIDTLDGAFNHFYSVSGNVYRGFTEIGRMWSEIGQHFGRDDVAAHGAQLLAVAPRVRLAMHASLNKTISVTGNPAAPTCIPSAADPTPDGSCVQSTSFRSYPELMYSGSLTAAQADAMYLDLSLGNKSGTRPMTLGRNL